MGNIQEGLNFLSSHSINYSFLDQSELCWKWGEISRLQMGYGYIWLRDSPVHSLFLIYFFQLKLNFLPVFKETTL